MSWTDRRGISMVKWDFRPTWKKVWEWPFRRMGWMTYDQFIDIPEDEVVWPAEQDPEREEFIAMMGLIVFIVIVSGAFILALWTASFVLDAH